LDGVLTAPPTPISRTPRLREASPEDQPITERLAEFVVSTRPAGVPANVFELGRKSVLDGLGLAACGSRTTAASLVRHSIGDRQSAQDRCTVIGTPLRVRADLAALANGTAIHVDDYDDIQLAASSDRVYGLLTHPTAPVLSAALAVAERDAMSGSALLTGYLIGVEVACKVAEAIAPRHYVDGFHCTGTCGTIGAAAAVASLLELSREQTLHALGIAASQASGLRASFGTMTKSLHAGRAAQNGIEAAELAGVGFTASDRVLEAPAGFFQAAGGGYDAGTIIEALGNPWTFLEPGIAIKPYPCASLTHPALDTIIALRREHDLEAVSIRRVRVGTNSRTQAALSYHRPTTALEAKFSMEYCLAVAILYGRAGLAEFEDDVVDRADVRRLLERISSAADPRADAAGFDRMASFLSVELVDGSVLEGRADFPRGTPSHPLAFAEVATKFGDCARHGALDEDGIARVVELVRSLETLADVRELTASLRARAPAEEEAT
jgi:2-methylcitrate dehydratase PrpD